jgi:pimeloyl-ACP methyl ester carboxylesterase
MRMMSTGYLRRRGRWTIPAATILVLLLLGSIAVAGTKKVVLTTTDGYRITGILTEPPGGMSRAGVVLLHMYRHTKEGWAPLIPHLIRRGITTLAIDMRGHGESRLGPHGRDDGRRVLLRDASLFNGMHLDAEAAVRYLQDKGIESGRIGIIGASVGCSVAIHTAVAGSVKVASVVVMTPGERYLGVPTMDHIRIWPGIPLLILSSREEAGKGAVPIFRELKKKGAELRLFDESGVHGTYMFGEVEGVEELISSWTAEKLLH